MERELSIASLNSDQDPYALKPFVTACTLFVININYKLQALIDIDAHDYAFINFIAAHSLCELFLISLISLIKSKLIWEFNEKHDTPITHQILIDLRVTDHSELFCSLLIITLSQHDIVLEKIWMNHHEILLNISADKLHFLPERCDHLRALTVILSAKNIYEVNLSLSHWRTATPSKALVSLVKISLVKTSLIKWPSGKPSLLYLFSSQWPDWQYFWQNSNFLWEKKTSLCALSDAQKPLFSDISYESHWTETEIAYWKINAAVNLIKIEAAVSA